MMQDDRGFTIVEALTAIAILSVSLVSLYGVGADALNASSHAATTDRAIMFADTKLAELSLVHAPLPTTDSGESSESGFKWRVTASELPGARISSEPTTLQAVTLEVSWLDAVRERSLIVETRHLGVNGR